MGEGAELVGLAHVNIDGGGGFELCDDDTGYGDGFGGECEAGGGHAYLEDFVALGVCRRLECSGEFGGGYVCGDGFFLAVVLVDGVEVCGSVEAVGFLYSVGGDVAVFNLLDEAFGGSVVDGGSVLGAGAEAEFEDVGFGGG